MSAEAEADRLTRERLDAVAEERKALREWAQRRRTNDTSSGTICADDLLAALDAREKESQ